MSVPKSRRGESPAEYINLAREIYVFTYNRVRILPKSYTFYFSLPLYNAAREAYRMIKTANLIYVDEKAPEEIRRRNIQRRKEYYETAQGYRRWKEAHESAFTCPLRARHPAGNHHPHKGRSRRDSRRGIRPP